MLPVTSLNGLEIGDGRVGNVFSKLLSLWSEKMGIDIISQIQQWDAESKSDLGHNAPTPYRFVKK